MLLVCVHSELVKTAQLLNVGFKLKMDASSLTSVLQFHIYACSYFCILVRNSAFWNINFSHFLTLILPMKCQNNICDTGVIVKNWSPVGANVFKCSSHFLFYEVQYGWFSVEVFNQFGLEFCAW